MSDDVGRSKRYWSLMEAIAKDDVQFSKRIGPHVRTWLNEVEDLIASQPKPAPVLTDEQIDAGIKAWFSTDITTNDGKDRGHPFRGRMRAAIDATKPTPVLLTEDEIVSEARGAGLSELVGFDRCELGLELRKFARAIESAVLRKNGLV